MIVYHPSTIHRNLCCAIFQLEKDLREVKPQFNDQLECTNVGSINLLAVHENQLIYYLLCRNKENRQKMIMDVGTRLVTVRPCAQTYDKSVDAYFEYKNQIDGLDRRIIHDINPNPDRFYAELYQYDRPTRLNHIDLVFYSILLMILRVNVDGVHIAQSLRATFNWQSNLKIERDYLTQGLRFQSGTEANSGNLEELVTSLLSEGCTTPISEDNKGRR